MALPAIVAAGMRVAAAAGAGEAAGASSAGRVVAQLGQVAGSMQQVGQSAQRATHWVGGLAGRITGTLGKAMTMWIGWVEQAAKPIENLVRIANPAIADAFGRAVADAYGVVGRMLIPVLNAFTGVARKVGDVMAALEPVFQPAINAIGKLVDAIGEEFVRYLREGGPAFEHMADMIGHVATVATTFVRVLGQLAHVFREITNPIFRLLGYKGDTFDPNASAVGSAARQARFTQPKEISDDAIKNALSMGIGKEKSPKTLNDVWERLDKIHRFIVQRWGQAQAIAEGGGFGAGKVAGQELADANISNSAGAAGYRLGRYLATRGK